MRIDDVIVEIAVELAALISVGLFIVAVLVFAGVATGAI